MSLDDFSVASGALGRHRGIQVVLVISKRETNGALWCTPILRSHKMCFTDILRSFLLGNHGFSSSGATKNMLGQAWVDLQTWR